MSERRTTLSRIARIVLPWLATLGLLLLLAARIDLDRMGRALAEADVAWVLLAAALGPLQIALSAERWRIAAVSAGSPLTRQTALREFALSALLNQVLPGGVSGDVIRAMRAGSEQAPMVGAWVVLTDRLVGLTVHLLLVLVGVSLWPLLHEDAPAPWPVVLLSISLLILFFVGLISKTPLGKTARDALMTGSGPRQIALSALLTASFIAAFACCGRAIGRPLGALSITAVPVVLLSMALPLTVGGWGLREWTASAVLPPLGMSEETAVACSALYGISVWLGALPSAVLFIPSRSWLSGGA